MKKKSPMPHFASFSPDRPIPFSVTDPDKPIPFTVEAPVEFCKMFVVDEPAATAAE